MKILILTSSNPYIAAGVVAHNLFTGLKKDGHYVKMIVKVHGQYKEKDIVSIEKRSDFLIKKIKNKIRKILKIKKKLPLTEDKYGIEDYDLTKQFYKTSKILKHIDFKPDVILYLFPSGFLNLENLYEINKATDATIFWYLMDPAALTGGCHYFWECNKYLTGCGKCPGMYSDDENDQSSINFKFKQKFINKTDINIITGTQTDSNQAKKSLLFRNIPVHKILLPVDHNIFKPAEKQNLRNELKLPNDKVIFFIGSSQLFDIRKGMTYLMKALKLIKQTNEEPNIFLLIAGNGFEFIENDLPFYYKYLGNLANNHQLASAFQASDFFICPSIQDAGPFMINQSIMCGTPVVSFDIGVANDLVFPNKTGFLVELKNVEKLSQTIIEASSLSKKEIQKMSTNCRSLGLEILHQDIFVEEIEKVFINHIQV